MKLLEIEIDNVRGIRHILLKPAAGNIVIWGPNGAGKSAVVDAIDFLLTGKISRLQGKGTGGISLNRHGPHIDFKPENAVVRAIIRVSGYQADIEIKRSLDNPGKLEMEAGLVPILAPVLELARRGQHVLTRREILKYITAEGGTRAQEIQELLNLGEIEEVRKSLVKVANECEREQKAALRNVDIAKGAVIATIGHKTYDENGIVEAINQYRRILDAEPISRIISAEIKNNAKLPTETRKAGIINVTLFENDMEVLGSLAAENTQTSIEHQSKELITILDELHKNPELLRNLSKQKLFNLGKTLIDVDGACPLCDTPWTPGELGKLIDAKLASAQIADVYDKSIQRISESLISHVTRGLASIDKAINASKIVGLEKEKEELISWQKELHKCHEVLIAPIDELDTEIYSPPLICKMVAPDGTVKLIENLRNTIKSKFPEASPEQNAWDALTRLEENLKALEKARIEYTYSDKAFKRSAKLLSLYQQSRDSVLKALYDNIRDRFVELYKKLHGTDENRFTAEIEPDGAALTIGVDFYGRGTHPPHALHSEGHQDSMGLCLYLALAEHLTRDVLDLIILDDVVMSVDAEHRKELCGVLAQEFPKRQFIITTHDKNWATQLRSEKVVSGRNLIEFYNWSIEAGPSYNSEDDIWGSIADDIGRNKISDAAGTLRRGLEQYFSHACDKLRAQIIYKLMYRWELGELLPAAIAQYKKLLKMAKKAANSWSDDDTKDLIEEIESTLEQIYQRTKAEQWIINENVHYNHWASFSPKDFQPVVDAFHDLCSVFVCQKCETMLFVTVSGATPTNLRCNCGKVNWNLREK